MKKILIISYFYPPCNLTAAQRAQAFSKYLPEFGFHPIILTRNWDLEIKNQYDISKPSGSEVKYEKNDRHEVYYLPFKGSFRDRFLQKYGKDKYKLFRKLLTFGELIMESIEHFPDAWMLIYEKARELIKKEQIEYLLISANPFWLFYFGYRLKKEFPHLKWIADYRDDWTTGDLGKKTDLASKFILRRSQKNEKKWLKSANLVTSVSTILSHRIGDNVGIPSKTIANGFFHETMTPSEKPSNPHEFVITYTGYLYDQQNIEWFIHALKKAIDRNHNEVFIRMQFIGSAYEANSDNRIRKLMKGYEKNLLITERISREETIRYENDSDLLLMVAYRNFKGIPGSKLYQYIGLQKPILLCPSDNDIVEHILEETGLGIICYSREEAEHKLESLIRNHLNETPLVEPISSDRYLRFSRYQQVEKLANTLKQL